MKQYYKYWKSYWIIREKLQVSSRNCSNLICDTTLLMICNVEDSKWVFDLENLAPAQECAYLGLKVNFFGLIVGKCWEKCLRYDFHWYKVMKSMGPDMRNLGKAVCTIEFLVDSCPRTIHFCWEHYIARTMCLDMLSALSGWMKSENLARIFTLLRLVWWS